ncbi:MAG: hypothetical protein ACK5LT_04425 [Lachnospirales bacterium]
MKVNVYKSSYISTPIGIGIFEKSIILIDKPYTDKELYYILLHEYTQFLTISVLSYAYILQPHFSAPEGESITISDDEAYIIKTKGGKYLFFIDGVLDGKLSKETAKIFVDDRYMLVEEE